MARITKEELEDLESGLIVKPYVIGYNGNDYVFTVLNSVDTKNMRKMNLNKNMKEEDKESQLMEMVLSHCIWPEKEVFDEIAKVDGGLAPALAGRYFTCWTNQLKST